VYYNISTMKTSSIGTLILVAVWFVFSLAGSAQEKGTDHIHKTTGDYKSHPKPLAPPVVKSNAAPSDQNQSNAVAKQDTEHRVRIGTPVAVSTIKDRWDKALVLFTGLVVIVGGFQIWFLWRTVQATSDNAIAAKEGARSAADNAEAARASARSVEAQNATLQSTLAAIQRQADTMQQQTTILQRNIDVVIDKERARLRVRLLEFDPWGEPAMVNLGASQAQWHVLRLQVSFFGSTTAFITESSAAGRLFDSSEPAIEAEGYTFPMRGLPDEITSATATPIVVPLPITEEVLYAEVAPRLSSIADPTELERIAKAFGKLTAFDAEKIKNGKQFIHVYGFIRYGDVFGNNRESTFRLRWQPILGFTLKGDPAGQWVKWGPPEANHET